MEKREQIDKYTNWFIISQFCRPLDALTQREVACRCRFWRSADTFSNGIIDDVVFAKSGRLVHLVHFNDWGKGVQLQFSTHPVLQ